MPLLEKEIEARTCDYARRKGWQVALKLASRQHSGWPDRMFIRKGPVFLFVEFKREGQWRTSKLQEARIGLLRMLGCKVHIVDSVQEGQRVVDLYT